MGNPFAQRILRFLNSLPDISTRPDDRAWKWRDKKSVLAALLFYGIWVLRYLSLLQWAKHVARQFPTRGREDIDKGSRRPNIGPSFVEKYFLIWLVALCLLLPGPESGAFVFAEIAVFLLVLSLVCAGVVFSALPCLIIFVAGGLLSFTGQHPGGGQEILQGIAALEDFLIRQRESLPVWIPRLAAAYFLFESSLWLLYYNVLRRFYEEKYAIYHRLEYFVVLPVVFVAQALSIAFLNDINFNQAAHAILGTALSSDTLPFYVSLLSVMYIAIVITLIMSQLPKERTKDFQRKYLLTVIGVGDVVRQRLFPALCREIQHRKVLAVSTEPELPLLRQDCPGFPIEYRQLTDASEQKIFGKIIDSDILWIATPSHTHIRYLEEWIYQDLMIVVEKPLTSLACEMETLLRLYHLPQWNKVFALNYYYLEKALPLTFLFHPLHFYRKYLRVEDGHHWEQVHRAFRSLGPLSRCEICLLEGEETRPWALDTANGGQYMETFIHVALLGHMILGRQGDPEILSWSLGDYNDPRNGAIHPQTFISCEGTWAGVDFYLCAAKFIPARHITRYIALYYAEGSVFMDLNTRCCSIRPNDGQVITLKVDPLRWEENYSIQLDMVLRCNSGSIKPSLVDGSALQLRTLQWLFGADRENAKRFDYYDHTFCK